jgi:regulator of replication initiation timing
MSIEDEMIELMKHNDKLIIENDRLRSKLRLRNRKSQEEKPKKSTLKKLKILSEEDFNDSIEFFGFHHKKIAKAIRRAKMIGASKDAIVKMVNDYEKQNGLI